MFSSRIRDCLSRVFPCLFRFNMTLAAGQLLKYLDPGSYTLHGAARLVTLRLEQIDTHRHAQQFLVQHAKLAA